MNANHWVQFFRSDGIVLAHTRESGEWGVYLEERDAIFFHFVAEGTAFVNVADGELVELSSGDIAVFSRGSAHRLLSAPDSRATALFDFLKSNDGDFSKGQKATSVICGAFGLNKYTFLPALKSLPDFFCIKATPENKNSPVSISLRQLKSEVERAGIASQVIVRHLLSALFIYILREWAEVTGSDHEGWFAAMQNPNISKALERIHKNPSHSWTLSSLSKEAGLSRAAFAKQFRDLVGETPYAYLTRWRMGIASQLLAETDMTLAQIATQVGYSSEYSFSRAFKQIRGKSPTHDRRAATA